MTKNTKVFLLFILGVIFACMFYIWATLSPTVTMYRLIYNRATEMNLAIAFASALSINHPAAYDMIDPSLSPRLDEWMSTHRSIKCTRQLDYVFVGAETEIIHSYGGYFSCFGVNRWEHFDVEIIIEDMKVIDFRQPFE